MTRILTAAATAAALTAIVLWATDLLLWRSQTLTGAEAERLYLIGLGFSIGGCVPALIVLARVLRGSR